MMKKTLLATLAATALPAQKQSDRTSSVVYL